MSISLVSRAAQSCSLNRCFDKSFGFYILSVLSHIGHSALPAFRECYGNFIHTNPTIKNPRAGHLVRQPIQVGLVSGEGIHLSGLQHFFTSGNEVAVLDDEQRFSEVQDTVTLWGWPKKSEIPFA